MLSPPNLYGTEDHTGGHQQPNEKDPVISRPNPSPPRVSDALRFPVTTLGRYREVGGDEKRNRKKGQGKRPGETRKSEVWKT